MKPVHVVSLVLTIACAGVPDAVPTVDAAAAAKAKVDVDALAAQTELLQQQLADAVARIAKLEAQAKEADAALFLTDGATGARVNRVEALEGTVLEVDPKGVVGSQLVVQGKAARGPYYNKIKWTYAVHGRTVAETLVGHDATSGVDFDRVGALEQTLLPVDPKTGEVTATAQRTAYNKIKWDVDAYTTVVGELKTADAAATTRLATLEKTDAGVAKQLGRLAATDAALWDEVDDLSALACELSSSTDKVLTGRWDGAYSDGKQPTFFADVAIDTLDGPVTWASWVDRGLGGVRMKRADYCGTGDPVTF